MSLKGLDQIFSSGIKVPPPERQALVSPMEGEQRKFIQFPTYVTKRWFDENFRPGMTLTFTGEAAGEVTIQETENPSGGPVGALNKLGYRFTGVTSKGHKIKVHIWFVEESQFPDATSCLFINPAKATAVTEKASPAAAEFVPVRSPVQFEDGWENIRDNRDAFTTGNLLNIRIRSANGWVPKEVRITSRKEDPATGTITLKVAGERSRATIILYRQNPDTSEIIFET